MWSFETSFCETFLLIPLYFFSNVPDKVHSVKCEKGNNSSRAFQIALLFHEIYLPTTFYVNISSSFRVMSRTKLKVKKWTMGNNSKIRQNSVTVLLHCTSTQWDLSSNKVFMFIFLVVSEECHGIFFLKGEIILKTGHLWFLGTALCLSALYHCVQFKLIMSKSFQVMFPFLEHNK
jgi:hypothetical protein